jgi:hypothetical protein
MQINRRGFLEFFYASVSATACIFIQKAIFVESAVFLRK